MPARFPAWIREPNHARIDGLFCRRGNRGRGRCRGLGGGLLISNIVSPHEPRIEMTQARAAHGVETDSGVRMRHRSRCPISRRHTRGIQPDHDSNTRAANRAGQCRIEAGAAGKQRRVREVRLRVRRRRHRRKPRTQAENSEKAPNRSRLPKDAFAKARDADVRREARRAEQKRRAERRQLWAERRRPRQDQELRDVEAKVREETEPRQVFTAEPVRLETPRIENLFDME